MPDRFIVSTTWRSTATGRRNSGGSHKSSYAQQEARADRLQGRVKKLEESNLRLMRKNFSLKENFGSDKDLAYQRRELCKAVWVSEVGNELAVTRCNICDKQVHNFDFAVAHITAESDLRYKTAGRGTPTLADLDDLCVTCGGCNFCQGTNDLWQWLEFKARDLSAAQQRMRVRWKAWLDKKLGRRKEKK